MRLAKLASMIISFGLCGTRCAFHFPEQVKIELQLRVSTISDNDWKLILKLMKIISQISKNVQQVALCNIFAVYPSIVLSVQKRSQHISMCSCQNVFLRRSECVSFFKYRQFKIFVHFFHRAIRYKRHLQSVVHTFLFC